MQFVALTAPDLHLLHTDVPLTGVTITEALNAPCGLEATLDVKRAYESIYLSAEDRTVALIRLRGTVLVGIDGGQVWAWLVEDAVRDVTDQQRLRIAASGIGVLPDSIPWVAPAERLVEVDVFDVVRMIWDHVVDRTRSLPVTVDSGSAGVTVGVEPEDVDFETGEGERVQFQTDDGPFKLNWWSTDDLKKELDDLAEATPFEWREQVAFDPESEEPPSLHIELGSPRLPVAERAHLHFEVGVNVSEPEPPEETEPFTEVLVLGNGEGSDKIRARAHREGSWQRTVKTISDQSITTQRQARRVAQKAVDEADRDARTVETCTVAEHPAAPLSAFGLGDVITIVGETAWGEVHQVSRIVEITRNVGSASVSLTLARWRD